MTRRFGADSSSANGPSAPSTCASERASGRRFDSTRHDFAAQGYRVIKGLFSIEELGGLHEHLLQRYERYFEFGRAGTSLDRLEAARVLDPNAHTRVDDLRSRVRRLALDSPQLAELFVEVLNVGDPTRLELSRFCDFRINVPQGAKLRRPTAWHQDAQTDYCYFPDQMRHPSATCWIAVSRATAENSIELIPSSHRPRRIYYQDFRNRRFDPMKLRESPLWDAPVRIEAECGDAVLIDPFLWHRSTVNISTATRFSCDVRFLDTGSDRTDYEADLRLLGFRLASYGFAALRSLTRLGRAS